jgi:hypothetical protein
MLPTQIRVGDSIVGSAQPSRCKTSDKARLTNCLAVKHRRADIDNEYHPSSRYIKATILYTSVNVNPTLLYKMISTLEAPKWPTLVSFSGQLAIKPVPFSYYSPSPSAVIPCKVFELVERGSKLQFVVNLTGPPISESPAPDYAMIKIDSVMSLPPGIVDISTLQLLSKTIYK